MMIIIIIYHNIEFKTNIEFNIPIEFKIKKRGEVYQ